MKKKYIIAGIGAVLLAAVCAGCGSREKTTAEEDRLQIVCTIFPQYDWTRELLGDRLEDVELTLLMKDGADLHSYQPTVWDMAKIADADLFLYVGGESDFWIEDVLANMGQTHMRTLNLMEILEEDVYEEEHMEGMQEPRGHDHEEEGQELPEYDEHVWLSLRNAQKVCTAVTEALCELDEEYSSVYRQNLEDYGKELQALDAAYEQTVEQASGHVLLFGDRFPFRYLVEDYGLRYYAAFAGCSAETEASFETITFLAGKADELGIPVVLAIDGSDGRIAETIAGNTKTRDQQVLILDSMQSVTGEEIEQGENYLSVMEENLLVLEAALAGKERQ
ncbi:MAG: zinc ABC transporter substrate-binding protein [Clostridiales bacterium]|nr:zinc ABC transporter substrate-binding protein [Clostridiales bacterium]